MGDDYSVEGDVVRYGGYRLQEADASSFERLSPDDGRDHRLVFWRSLVLGGADPRTFLALGESYGRDASHAFWGVNTINVPLDLSAFRVLGSDHATDGRLVLWGNTGIEEADRDSFRVLSGRVAVDRKRVYFDGTPVAGADAATFEVLSEGYSRDRHHVFYYREPLSGPVPASFEIISEAWTRDERRAFFFLHHPRRRPRPGRSLPVPQRSEAGGSGRSHLRHPGPRVHQGRAARLLVRRLEEG